MPRLGRPRSHEGEMSDWQKKKLPKKETEEHRQMRADYLAMPPAERNLRVIAKKYNCSYGKVHDAATAFGWLDDADQRDGAISDPFVEQNRKEIDSVRGEAFRYLCTALKNEIKRQSFELNDADIIAKLQNGDLDEAVRDWSMKDWMSFVKNLSLRAKDYKDFINIIDGIRKVVFDWNPNQVALKTPGGLTIPGNNNKVLIHYD